MPRVKNDPAAPKRPKRVTLQDIAKVAGVHVMTVSDALNGTRSVAPATRERVKKIAQELNYVPNFAARALVTGRTGIVVVLSRAMNEHYYANMIHLLERHLNNDGYKLMLLRTPHDVKDLVNATGNLAVDGAIAIDMYHLVDEFRARQVVPCVSIGVFNPSFVDHVVIDLSGAVEEALHIMINAGRKRIAYLVTAPHLSRPTEGRARAYLKVMEEAGRQPEIINVDNEEFAMDATRLRAYLDTNGCPDALLCQNDDTAMAAFRVLRDAGMRVPEDVMMVGCDGQPHMQFFDPPLSTVAQPMDEMCALAWKFLQRRMAQPGLPLQHSSLPGKLVVRASLGKEAPSA
jgi:DNA-binding LacI/PurR family transcriptional regulator